MNQIEILFEDQVCSLFDVFSFLFGLDLVFLEKSAGSHFKLSDRSLPRMPKDKSFGKPQSRTSQKNSSLSPPTTTTSATSPTSRTWVGYSRTPQHLSWLVRSDEVSNIETPTPIFSELWVFGVGQQAKLIAGS